MKIKIVNSLITFIVFINLVNLTTSSFNLIILPENPKVVGRLINENVSLTCGLENPPKKFKLAWFDKDHREIKRVSPQTKDSGVWISREDNEVHLFIIGFHKRYEGNYTCKILINKVVRKEVVKEIRYETYFKKAPQEQYFIVGTDAFVICELKDNNEIEVIWKKHSQRLHQDGKYVMNITGMLIQNSNKNDSGNYSCEVHILNRNELKNIEVYFQEIPKITLEINDNSGMEGTDLLLTCQAKGEGVTYTFFINDIQLDSTWRVNINSKKGRIFFSPLRRSDEGIVICLARNKVGRAKSYGYLVVQILSSILSFPNMTVNLGENSSLVCTFEGNPTPSVVITKLGKEDDNKSSSRVDSNTFVISNATPEDAGQYSCELYSELGNASKLAVVNVKTLPRASPHQVYEWSSFPFNTMNITCIVLGYPPPSFFWYFNGVELSNNATFKKFDGVHQSNLQIYVDEEDMSWIFHKIPAEVTCRAENSEGRVNVDMRLHKTTVASQLENLTYYAYPCLITFDYVLPEDTGDEPVIGLVAYVDDEIVNSPLKKKLRIEDLQNQTSYSIKVACRTIVGIGTLSQEFQINTTEPSRPYPVEITAAVNTTKSGICGSAKIVSNDYSVCVEWEEPIDVCLPIQSYRIRYRLIAHDPDTKISNPQSDWVTINDYNGAAMSVKLQDLQRDSYYEIELFAMNKLGESNSSGLFVFKTHKKGGEVLESQILPKLAIASVVVLFVVMIDLTCYLVMNKGLISYLISADKKQVSNRLEQKNKSVITQQPWNEILNIPL